MWTALRTLSAVAWSLFCGVASAWFWLIANVEPHSGQAACNERWLNPAVVVSVLASLGTVGFAFAGLRAAPGRRPPPPLLVALLLLTSVMPVLVYSMGEWCAKAPLE